MSAGREPAAGALVQEDGGQGRSLVVCAVEELPPGGRRIVRMGNAEVGVFNVDGRYYALPNRCPHQLGPLCEGTISGTLVANAETGWRPTWTKEGEILTCPWHGLEFDIPSGQCLAYARIRLRRYRVSVRDGRVVLEL